MLNATNPGVVQVGATPQIKKKVNVEEMRKRDSVLVRGRFVNLENPGATFKFPYKAYEGDPVMKYTLKDGKIYELPRGVARHLNNDVGYKVHQYALDAAGNQSTRIGTTVRRVMFEHLEFVDIEDIQPRKEIVTVEKVPKLKRG